MAANGGTLPHRRVRLSWTGAWVIVGTIVLLIVARRIFTAAHRPLSWAVAATVAAVLIDPIVDRLAVHIRRVPAVLLTFVAIGAIGFGGTYVVFDEVQAALERLETAAPEAAASVEQRDDRLGEIARDANLGERVDSFVAVLQERVTGSDDVVRSAAGTAPTYFVSAILTIFLMTYGPQIAHAALAQDPDEARRARTALVVGAAVARARRAVVQTAAAAVALGLAGTAVAAALDLPAPSAVGVALGVTSILPHVGVIAGSVPLLLLTVGFRSGTAALVLLAVAFGVQVFDSLVVRPHIARRSVEVGLVVPWVVALLGYSVYGIGGAAYGVVIAVFAVAVLDRLEAANAARDASTPAPSGRSEPSAGSGGRGGAIS